MKIALVIVLLLVLSAIIYNARRRGWCAALFCRTACRDCFRETRLLKKLIPDIENVLAAGEIEPPPPPADAQPALPMPGSLSDPGHRSG